MLCAMLMQRLLGQCSRVMGQYTSVPPNVLRALREVITDSPTYGTSSLQISEMRHVVSIDH